MIWNLKSKYLEELKMTRAEEYDYNKFLSDSSDDSPKYGDMKDDQTEVYKMTASVSVEDLDIAFHNLLEVSREFLDEQNGFSITDVERERITESIQIVEGFKENLVDSNVALAKADS